MARARTAAMVNLMMEDWLASRNLKGVQENKVQRPKGRGQAHVAYLYVARASIVADIRGLNTAEPRDPSLCRSRPGKKLQTGDQKSISGNCLPLPGIAPPSALGNFGKLGRGNVGRSKTPGPKLDQVKMSFTRHRRVRKRRCFGTVTPVLPRQQVH